MQPLADVDTPGGFAWGHGFVMELLRLQGVLAPGNISAAEAGDAVDAALHLLAASPPAERTLSHLAHLVPDNLVRVALEPYCRGGPYGDLVDAAEDRLLGSCWTTVDIGALIDRGPGAAPVIQALFRRFYRLFEDGRPTLFLVDEAFKALKHQPAELDELRRRGPKKNVALVLATHQLDDIEGSAIAAMLKTIQVLVLLADPNAAKRHAFRDWGLNATQAAQVARAMPRRDVFFKTPEGSRLGQLTLDPAALAVCGCGGAAQRRAFELITEAGPALRRGMAAPSPAVRGRRDPGFPFHPSGRPVMTRMSPCRTPTPAAALRSLRWPLLPSRCRRLPTLSGGGGLGSLFGGGGGGSCRSGGNGLFGASLPRSPATSPAAPPVPPSAPAPAWSAAPRARRPAARSSRASRCIVEEMVQRQEVEIIAQTAHMLTQIDNMIRMRASPTSTPASLWPSGSVTPVRSPTASGGCCGAWTGSSGNSPTSTPTHFPRGWTPRALPNTRPSRRGSPGTPAGPASGSRPTS